MRRLGIAMAAPVALALLAGFVWAKIAGDGLYSGPTHGASVERFEVESRLLGESRRQTLIRPRGASEGRPLLLFLHGRGNDSDSNLTESLFAGLDALGERAPAIAFVDGGDHSYYHDRDDGPWGRYVIDEVLPAAIERLDADPRRVAIGGISMGGFGAFDLARLHPDRFCAVGGHSAALWESADQTPEGAFDDAEDFSEHDVIGAVRADPAALGDGPIWIDGGDADPFRTANDALASALQTGRADVVRRTWPGGHEGDYWSDHMPAYLRFYARALETCGA